MSAMSATRKLVSVAVTAANSQDFTVTINGTDFTYASDGSATTAEITVGLKALINAGSEPVLASGTDTPLLIESTIDGVSGDFVSEYAAGGAGDLVETVLVAQSQEVPFGKFVCMDERSSEAQAARLPRSSADVTTGVHFGVALEDRAREDNGAAFPANTMFPVLKFGRCWVEVEQDVTKGDAAYVRYAAGGSGLGSFGNSAGSSERAALARAVYLTTAASGERAKLELCK
jgi:hypothetical protein